MAINFTDFSKAPIQGSPLKDIFESALKGYKMQQEPGKMAQEKEEKRLSNSLKQLALEHKPKEYQLADALSEARRRKAEQPAVPTGALAQAFALRKQFPEGSKEYEQVNNYINKLGSSSNGVQISTNPEGGVEVSVGGHGEVANAMGLTPLPKGQTYLFDENKKPIGIGKPYSETEKKEEKGRAAFNVWQKFITDAQSPYSGKESNARFLADVAAYESDPEAQKRIDNLLAADDLLFSSTVKEEAALGGANTNQAYNRITHSLKNSEIYPLLQNISQYTLPKGYKKNSSYIFNKLINEGTDAGKNIPAYKPYYFNPKQNNAKGSNQRVFNLQTKRWE